MLTTDGWSFQGHINEDMPEVDVYFYDDNTWEYRPINRQDTVCGETVTGNVSDTSFCTGRAVRRNSIGEWFEGLNVRSEECADGSRSDVQSVLHAPRSKKAEDETRLGRSDSLTLVTVFSGTTTPAIDRSHCQNASDGGRNVDNQSNLMPPPWWNHRTPTVDQSTPLVSHRTPTVDHSTPLLSHRTPTVDHSTPPVSHRKQPVGNVTKRKVSCAVCKTVFSRQHELFIHMALAHSVEPPNCSRPSDTSVPNSGETKSTQSSRPKYQQLKKLYKCEICGKMLAWLDELKQHMEAFHVGVKKFPCRFCPRTFYHRAGIRAHTLTHLRGNSGTPDGPGSSLNQEAASCCVCHKRYASKYYLQYHRCGFTPGVKSHCCSLCGKKYRHEKRLLWHLRYAHSLDITEGLNL